MMKLKVLGTLGIALMGMMMVGSATFAQGNGDGMGGGRKHMQKLEKAAERLNLTADQKAKIKALRDQFKTAHQSTFAEMKSLKAQIKAAGKGTDQAKALREQMKAKMESLRPAQEQLHQQILAILTPEQRAQMEQMKAERKQKGGKRGKGRSGSQNLK